MLEVRMINWQRTRMTHFSEVLQLQCKVFVRFARNQRPAFWEPTMMRMRVRMMKTMMTYQQEPITKKPHHGSVLLHQQLMEEK